MATKTATKAKVHIRPLADKIVVRRDEAEDRTESGIFLPEQAKDTPKTGVVEAVGEGKINNDTGQRIPMTVKKGDRVIFAAYAGTEVTVGDDEVLVMSEDEVLAVMD